MKRLILLFSGAGALYNPHTLVQECISEDDHPAKAWLLLVFTVKKTNIFIRLHSCFPHYGRIATTKARCRF